MQTNSSLLRFDVHAHFGIDDDTRVAGNQHVSDLGDDAVWSPEKALGFMDARGIGLQLLSLPMAMDPGLARAVNERGARIVAARPDRFGLLAALPMAAPERAVEELRHAGDDLGADGFVLLSNYDGAYLGDPRFDPVLAELDRRGASVLLHPTTPPAYDRLGLGRPGPLLEFPVDTARTVVDALYAGVFLRYPNLRLVLAHAGGALPGLFHRILALGGKPWVANPSGVTPQQLREQAAALYFETAIAAGALAPVLELAGPDHLLFGTDFPPAGTDVIDDAIAALTRDTALTRLDATFRTLFPRAAARAA